MELDWSRAAEGFVSPQEYVYFRVETTMKIGFLFMTLLCLPLMMRPAPVFAQDQNTAAQDQNTAVRGPLDRTEAEVASGAKYTGLSQHIIPQIDPACAARIQQFGLLMKAAQDLLATGKYGPAETTFSQALTTTPDNSGWDDDCWKGLAQAYNADGQTDKALAAYASLYNAPPGKSGSFLGDDATILQYAILLAQAGQADKAMAVYNQAIKIRNVNVEDEGPAIAFPEFGTGPGQITYDATLLQALAHDSIATRKLSLDQMAAIAHVQQGAALAPDNALVQFYLGYCLRFASCMPDGKPFSPALQTQNDNLSQAAYKKAASLDSGRIQAEAKKAIR